MTSDHDASVDTLHPGDAVLVTGNKHVQAIRETGTLIRDTTLGDALRDTRPRPGQLLQRRLAALLPPLAHPFDKSPCG